MKTIETELKLTLPKTQNAAFKRLLADHPATVDGPVTKHLVSVYFDTPALDLAKRDAALRLRRVDEQWIQTLKLAEQAGEGLHQRIEQEVLVSGRALELEKISQRKMHKFLSQAHIEKALTPLFTTDIKRTVWNLQDKHGSLLEVSLDEGSIESGQRALTLNEVEIELKHGEVQSLFALALIWFDTLALIPEPKTKAERGYALYLGDMSHTASYAQTVKQNTKSTAQEALRLIVLESLRHLQANVPGILASADLDCVHQARVALRRLRSAQNIFSDLASTRDWQTIMAETQWLAALLGNVRDLDVLLAETLPQIEAALKLETEFIPLKKVLLKLSNRHRRTLRAALISSRYATLLLRLLQWLNKPARKSAAEPAELDRFAQRALKKCWGQVDRRIIQWQSMDREQRHDLRKKAKKLRYAAEFFATQYPHGPVTRYLKKLQRLQRVLGHINDAATAQTLMNTLIEQRPSLAHAGGLVAGWLAATSKHSEPKLAAAIKQLKKADNFWSSQK